MSPHIPGYFWLSEIVQIVEGLGCWHRSCLEEGVCLWQAARGISNPGWLYFQVLWGNCSHPRCSPSGFNPKHGWFTRASFPLSVNRLQICLPSSTRILEHGYISQPLSHLFPNQQVLENKSSNKCWTLLSGFPYSPSLDTLTLNGLIKTPMPSRYLRIFYSCFIVILSRMIGPNYLFYHYWKWKSF